MRMCECGCGQRTPIAKATRQHLGTVKGEPIRFVQGHGNAVRRLALDRWEERDTGYETPCWIWMGARKPNGYGTVWLPNPRRKVGAHQAVYERLRGTVAPGLELDHLCRVRACVNPAHLEPVTHEENMRRGCNVRLRIEDVRVIKIALQDNQSGVDLAQRFGVSAATIYNIRAGRVWRTVA